MGYTTWFLHISSHKKFKCLMKPKAYKYDILPANHSDGMGCASIQVCDYPLVNYLPVQTHRRAKRYLTDLYFILSLSYKTRLTVQAGDYD